MQLSCNCVFWNMYVAICPNFIVFMQMSELLKLEKTFDGRGYVTVCRCYESFRKANVPV